jgi:hypothetical protein
MNNVPGPPPVRMPARRPLKVYGYDPSLGKLPGNELDLDVPYEPLAKGPIGKRLAVVDYDGHAETFYTPVDLDDPAILLRGGLTPSESDPRFHQQMVYAVASETLERFEVALGRRIRWRSADPDHPQLNLHPHALYQANAFYSRAAKGILFGYFRAGAKPSGEVLPGQAIFTCLSHDIIAHEVTHAVVDGIREYFTEATNVDVAAFHEAFADLSALFRHFSHREALLDALQRSGGLLYSASLQASSDGDGTGSPAVSGSLGADNPLVFLARQFGEVSGHGAGLRAALDQAPNPELIRSVTEPHERGSILVAAMFDAFFTTYIRRTADLFRVYRAGGGQQNPVDLPQALAELLAEGASKTADMFFQICARGLDYCPPVDITFGDFLRAVITADTDLYPVDAHNVRDSIMQAFRRRGLLPTDVGFFSEDALKWPEASDALSPVDGLVFGDPNGLSAEEKKVNGEVLGAWAKAHAKVLGFADGVPINARSFHPMFRVGEDGMLRVDMVIELIQTTEVLVAPDYPILGKFNLRSGVTLMVANQPVVGHEKPPPLIRYVIPKLASDERILRQRATIVGSNYMTGDNRIDFGLVHGV